MRTKLIYIHVSTDRWRVSGMFPAPSLICKQFVFPCLPMELLEWHHHFPCGTLTVASQTLDFLLNILLGLLFPHHSSQYGTSRTRVLLECGYLLKKCKCPQDFRQHKSSCRQSWLPRLCYFHLYGSRRLW